MSNASFTKGTPKQGVESDSGIASRRAEDDSQPYFANESAAFESPLPNFDTASVFTGDQMKSLSQSSQQSTSTAATGTNIKNESLITAVCESGEDYSVPSPIQTDTQYALKAEIARLQDDNQRLRLKLGKSTEVELSEKITQRCEQNEDQISALTTKLKTLESTVHAQGKGIERLGMQLHQVSTTADNTGNQTIYPGSEAGQLTETPSLQRQPTASQDCAHQEEEDIYESHKADFSGNPFALKGNKNYNLCICSMHSV